MASKFQKQYEALLAAGTIEPDRAQRTAVTRLARLAGELASWRRGRAKLLAYFRRGSDDPPQGLYIHGKVGRGKTMLMDLFFDAAKVAPKRRIHFHQFMAEAHDMIRDARADHDGDPLPLVAKRIADGAALLCFDEMHITDIADAMILGRLFKWLFKSGVVVVATSNNGPGDLYRHGLNRQLFLPFIDLIEDHMDVIELAAKKDFRLSKLAGRRRYFTPVDAVARQEMDRLWREVTGGMAGGALALQVKGRELCVPLAAQQVARFHFDDLCAAPLGPIDYLHIAQAFHTVFIDAVPVLTAAKRNEARRFINLIDTLYDNRISLVMSAEVEADRIYMKGDGADLFERTASRLIEMRSDAYLMEREHRHQVGPSGHTDEADAAPVVGRGSAQRIEDGGATRS